MRVSFHSDSDRMTRGSADSALLRAGVVPWRHRSGGGRSCPLVPPRRAATPAAPGSSIAFRPDGSLPIAGAIGGPWVRPASAGGTGGLLLAAHPPFRRRFAAEGRRSGKMGRRSGKERQSLYAEVTGRESE